MGTRIAEREFCHFGCLLRWRMTLSLWILVAVSCSSVTCQTAEENEQDGCMVSYLRMIGMDRRIIQELNIVRRLANVGLDMPTIRTGGTYGFRSLVTLLENRQLAQMIQGCAKGEMYHCKYYPPCLNGGECRLNRSRRYWCDCTSGYTGHKCQTAPPSARAEPRKDTEESCMVAYFRMSGVNATTVRRYQLEERLAVHGLNAERIISGRYDAELGGALVSNTIITGIKNCIKGNTIQCRLFPPCLHSSMCDRKSNSNTFYCRCKSGYSGRSCTDDIDECVSSTRPCNATQTCVNTYGSYTCQNGVEPCAAGSSSCNVNPAADDCSHCTDADSEDERLSNLLRRVEEKVERRKNRKTKNKERFRKLLLRVNKIAEAIRQIAGTNGTDVNAT
eukprot:scpid63647/ scgid35091/ Neurogenic locus Notch protein; Processed neurogenic locus Notch protein